MIYNFDPERWSEDRLALVERRHRRSEFDNHAFEAAPDRVPVYARSASLRDGA
jgi:hypothetical protein